MKKSMLKVLLPIALVAASGSALAAADGFYLGGNIGWNYIGYKASSFDYMSSASIRRSGLAGGADFGYQFNKNVAVELGYTALNRVNVKNIVMNSNPTGASTLANGHESVGVWDAAVRFMRSFDNGVGLGAKVGVARVHAAVGGGLNNSALGSDYQTHTRWSPEIGPRLTYDFNPNVSTGVAITHIFKTGNIPTIDTAMLNLTYHFG